MITMEEFDEEIEQVVERNLEYAGQIYKHQRHIKRQIEKDRLLFQNQSHSLYRGDKPFNLRERDNYTLTQAIVDIHEKIIPEARKEEKTYDFRMAHFNKTYISPKEKKEIRQQIALKAQKRKEQEKHDKFNHQNIPSYKAWNDRKAMEAIQGRMSERIKLEKSVKRFKPKQEKAQTTQAQKPQTAEQRMMERDRIEKAKKFQQNSIEIIPQKTPDKKQQTKEDGQTTKSKTIEQRSIERIRTEKTKQLQQNSNEITTKKATEDNQQPVQDSKAQNKTNEQRHLEQVMINKRRNGQEITRKPRR